MCIVFKSGIKLETGGKRAWNKTPITDEHLLYINQMLTLFELLLYMLPTHNYTNTAKFSVPKLCALDTLF